MCTGLKLTCSIHFTEREGRGVLGNVCVACFGVCKQFTDCKYVPENSILILAFVVHVIT